MRFAWSPRPAVKSVALRAEDMAASLLERPDSESTSNPASALLWSAVGSDADASGFGSAAPSADRDELMPAAASKAPVPAASAAWA